MDLMDLILHRDVDPAPEVIVELSTVYIMTGLRKRKYHRIKGCT